MKVKTVQFAQEKAPTQSENTLRGKRLQMKKQIHTLRNKKGNTDKIKTLE